jgi:hypothetical protein
MSTQPITNIHLLSCGPSVFETWTLGRWQYAVEHDEPIVGVNTIANRFQVDWLCVRDSAVVDWIDKWMTPFTGIARGRAIPKAWRNREYEWLGSWMRCRFTFPLALRWALLKWPEATVNVYGCDMTNERGACRDNGRHGEDRWEAEAKYIRRLLALFGGRIKFIGCGDSELINK